MHTITHVHTIMLCVGVGVYMCVGVGGVVESLTWHGVASPVVRE